MCLRPELLRAFAGFGGSVYPGGLLERRVKELVIIAELRGQRLPVLHALALRPRRASRASSTSRCVKVADPAAWPRASAWPSSTRGAVMADSNHVPEPLMARIREHSPTRSSWSSRSSSATSTCSTCSTTRCRSATTASTRCWRHRPADLPAEARDTRRQRTNGDQGRLHRRRMGRAPEGPDRERAARLPVGSRLHRLVRRGRRAGEVPPGPAGGGIERAHARGREDPRHRASGSRRRPTRCAPRRWPRSQTSRTALAAKAPDEVAAYRDARAGRGAGRRGGEGRRHAGRDRDARGDPARRWTAPDPGRRRDHGEDPADQEAAAAAGRGSGTTPSWRISVMSSRTLHCSMHLAVAEPQEVDVLVRHLAPGRRDAHEVAGVAAVVGQVRRHDVALADQRRGPPSAGRRRRWPATASSA